MARFNILVFTTSLDSQGYQAAPLRPFVARIAGSAPACIAAVALLYMLTAKLGFLLAGNPSVSVMWMPAGIALAAVLLAGSRVWPGIWLGSLLTYTIVYRGLPFGFVEIIQGVIIGAGTTLQAIVGAALIRRFLPNSNLFESPSQAFKFVCVVFAACTLAPSVGVGIYWAAGATMISTLPFVWLTWWFGEVMGALAVTPVLLAWCRATTGEPKRSAIELLFVFLVVVISSQIVFSSWFEHVRPSIDWMIIPGLIWVALRFNQRLVTLTLFLVTSLGMWWTAVGADPLAVASIDNLLLILPFHLGVIVLSVTLLFSTVNETRLETHRKRLTQFSVDHADFAVLWLAPDGSTISSSGAGGRFAGISLEDIVGISASNTHADSPANSWSAHWTELRQKKTMICESEFQTKDGNIIQIEVSENLIQFEGQEFDCVYLRDITERKRTARQLEMSQFSVNHTSDLLFWVGQDGGFIYANDVATRTLGFTLEEFLKMNVIDIEVGFTKDNWPDNWALLKEKKSLVVESSQRTKEGAMLDFEINANFATFDGKEYHIVFARDITERKQAESALRISEQRLSHAVAATQDGLWDWTIATGGMYYSPQWCQMLGYEQAEVPPELDFFFPLVHPEDVADVKQAIDDHLAGITAIKQGEIRLRLKSGEYRWFDDRGKVIEWDEAGQPTRMIGSIHDITSRKETEIALRESEERTRVIVQSAPDAVITMDCFGHIYDWNSQAEKIFGWHSSEVIGRLITDTIVPAEKRGAYIQAYQEYVSAVDPNESFELTTQTRDGERLKIDFRVISVSIHGEQQFSAFIRDITELKYAEKEREKLTEQLIQSQKMEAVGTLAGGIAHDFNNILAAIMGFTELAQMDANASANVKKSLQEILKASNRAKNLVSQILTVSRPQAHERKPTDLHAIVDEVIQMMRSTLPPSIEFSFNAGSEKGIILADTTQIHQVLLNLCANAAHAIKPNSGRIEIRTILLSADQARSQTQAEIGVGPYLCLSVKDTGSGIDADTAKLIFDPFFTTKEPGEGTGLGLAIVNSIVKAHEGAIQVDSQPGAGTSFHLYFPTNSSPTTEPATERPAPEFGKGERVMFVDDETALCHSTKSFLETVNYTVTTFTDPREALEKFLANPEIWDVVITDLSMPGMSGIMLADEILRQYPQTPILLASGHADTWTSEQVKSRGLFDLITKPYALAAFGETLQKALQSRENNDA